jgi:hypothetical protein
LAAWGVDLTHESPISGFSSSPGLASLIFNATAIFGLLFSLLVWPVLGMFFCTFPDGRFVPRWSWIIPGLFLLQFGFYAFPAPWNLQSWPQSLQTLERVLVYGSMGSTQIYRFFFVASPVQRQQMKWLAFGFALVVLLILPGSEYLQFLWLNDSHSLIQLSSPLLLMIGYLPIPLALGIALLRYRLWDIDHVINRTLVYGLLTLILAGVYLGLVFGGETLLVGIVGTNEDMVIVASTLIVAVLFQPLRQSIQNLIDRRFYRQKYNAQRTLQAFRETLYHELDLAQLSERIVAVAQETVQPEHISLWLLKSGPRQTLLLDSSQEETM